MKIVRVCGFLGSAVALCLPTISAAHAQGRPSAFTEKSGEEIFRHVCQDCHMPDARGATGAGTYPALARNPKLEVAGYPISVIIHGQKAMPAFGAMLSDQQVSEVVNYVRTHFGNIYQDKVTINDVKAAR